MKLFFKERSYDMVKMFLNQFATAVFGFVLALAAGKAQNPILRNITSIFAILFYLFLLYTMTWEIGFRDKTPIEKGRKKYNPLTGLLISLFANIPNFVFAIFIMLASVIDNPLIFEAKVLSSIGAFCASAALLLEGMYTGLLANTIHGVPLNSCWWMYFVIIVPSILVCFVSYILGTKDKKITRIFKYQYPESDRDPKTGKHDSE